MEAASSCFRAGLAICGVSVGAPPSATTFSPHLDKDSSQQACLETPTFTHSTYPKSTTQQAALLPSRPTSFSTCTSVVSARPKHTAPPSCFWQDRPFVNCVSPVP